MRLPKGTGSLAWGSPRLAMVMLGVAAVVVVATVWDFTWISVLMALYAVGVAVAAGRASLAIRRANGSGRQSR